MRHLWLPHDPTPLLTGKSGRYRYCTCAGCEQKGKTICLGRSISMPALDGAVLEHLSEQLFTPDRPQVILEAYIARSGEADVSRREQLAQARPALTEAQGRVGRLLELVEQGLMDVNDSSLKERLETAKLARQAATERVTLLEAAGASGTMTITQDSITRLAGSLRQVLQSDDPAIRKAYLRLFVDQVIVGDAEIRLRGPKAAWLGPAGPVQCRPQQR